MKVSDSIDIKRSIPEHKVIWHTNDPEYLDRGSTSWLQDNMGDMPSRYYFSFVSNYAMVGCWNKAEGCYDYDELTSSEEVTSRFWTPLISRVSSLIPDNLGVIRTLFYDVGDTWERCGLRYLHSNMNPRNYTLAISFRDDLLALQCKLALS
jgi:hypothetical protein